MPTQNPQRVLVTAGAGGIGRAIVQAFAQAGAQVYACDLDAAALAALHARDPRVGTGVCDVGDRAAVQRTVDEAAQRMGGLDVLVNNAGIAGPTAPLETLEAEAWETVLRVNLTGTFFVTQAAIPHLKRSAAGSVLMMSSLAGRFGYPNRSPYATSKWGLIGLTKTLSRELGPWGVRVNALLPGAVDGPRLQQVLADRARATGHSVDDETAAALANQSLQRFVDPAEIAAMALFLASDAARSISGQAISIDGDSQSAT